MTNTKSPKNSESNTGGIIDLSGPPVTDTEVATEKEDLPIDSTTENTFSAIESGRNTAAAAEAKIPAKAVVKGEKEVEEIPEPKAGDDILPDPPPPVLVEEKNIPEPIVRKKTVQEPTQLENENQKWNKPMDDDIRIPEETLPVPPPPSASNGYNQGIIQGVVIILAILAFILGYYIFYPMGKADGEKTSTARSMEKIAQEAWNSSQEIKKTAGIIKTASNKMPTVQLAQIRTGVDSNGRTLKAGLKAINQNLVTSIKKMDKDHKKVLKGQKKLGEKIVKIKIPAPILSKEITKKSPKKVRKEKKHWELIIVDEDGNRIVEKHEHH